mmetsp:Transcript_59352/g.168284  ORF Transcript_59352/g.168284 Transcript_59352/m.168284 type:complete len:230 (+) Transcript_59352:82-771(+)
MLLDAMTICTRGKPALVLPPGLSLSPAPQLPSALPAPLQGCHGLRHRRAAGAWLSGAEVWWPAASMRSSGLCSQHSGSSSSRASGHKVVLAGKAPAGPAANLAALVPFLMAGDTLEGAGDFVALAQSLAQQGAAKEACEVLDAMAARRVQHNVQTCASAVSAFDKAQQWQRAVEVLAEAENSGLEPDMVLFSAVISACERGAQWRMAVELLARMRVRSFEPNVISYSAA